MTHHTDAELLPCPFCGDHAETDFIPEHHSYAIECHSMGCAARVIKDTASDAIEAWNRRAPAAPVPQGWKIVPVIPTDEMVDAACQDGISLNGRPVWKHTHDVQATWRWQRMIAAAPQPPEAAPVQLPEPVAKIFFDRKGCEVSELPAWENLRPYGTHELVSVQQVRQLLANHGIQEQST